MPQAKLLRSFGERVAIPHFSRPFPPPNFWIFFNVNDFVSVFVHMGPHGSKIVKKGISSTVVKFSQLNFFQLPGGGPQKRCFSFSKNLTVFLLTCTQWEQ